MENIMKRSKLLLAAQKFVYFVLVDHHLFVGVFARFRVFDALYDFDKVTTRTGVGGALCNPSVF